MVIRDQGQLEALSLVAELYAAAGDSSAFQGVLDRCHAWLRQPEVAETPAAAFVRRQLIRARAAVQKGSTAADGTACAVVSVDDRGAVLAAGREAWAVLRCGHPGTDALTLPSTLTRQLSEARVAGGQLPRALRVPLDDGSGEVAVVLLESSGVSHAVGVLRVATFLLCGIPSPPPAEARPEGTRRTGRVRPFPTTDAGSSHRARPTRRAAPDD